MANAENFGMMDGAYFVSRTELLDWLNNTLSLNYSKVEQCCSGLAHLQLLDAMHPGKVQLHKANFDAKLEHEYINNFKVLQSAFNSVGIKKVIEIEKLVKGKYQDNLEFLQWMKRFVDAKMPNGPTHYDPVAARDVAVSTQRRLKQPRAKPGAKPAGKRSEGTTPSYTLSERETPLPSDRSPLEQSRCEITCDADERQQIRETLEVHIVAISVPPHP
eukprot:TRINITY_DN8096_c0_g1_i1.p1 TRINITY_DN8096_c0_g1~~TRINITY_DN8096_c0_g1_i1.p1  ORF type:complete len:231 (+),score=55.82 TRINITY_DN8096_c0_g1_i1:45-695(+)